MWTVLLVEDEVFVRESVKEIIQWETMGFRLIGESGNGIEAFNMVCERQPDVVLADIVMPGMDGIELLRRTREAGISSKFVMLTCMGEFEYVRQAMEYGASNYILKLSMNVKDLRETLRKVSAELNREAEQHKSNLLSEAGHAAAAEEESSITHPEVIKIIQHIQDNYDEDITVKSLSQYVMMGESYVSALFKKKTGQTLIHYLHRVRVDKAIDYLVSTKLPVSEIGQKVGFANDNYFIKIFKRQTGTTPSHYRKNKR